MVREFFKSVYYFVYQFFFSKFILLSFFNLNKILIFNKKKLNFFFQYINNKNDTNTFRQIFIKEEYKFNKKIDKLINNSYENILRDKKIPLIVDCGANICASANYFYIAFPESKIVAIEPDKINFDICKKNNLNNQRIEILNNAISNEKFNYSLERKNHDGRSSFIKFENNGTKKKSLPYTITMNDIMSNYKINKYKPFLIKIDIEGHEKKFFESNTDWMKYFKFIVIELHDWMLPEENISESFYKALKKNLLNYKIYNFGENTLIINKNN